MQQNTAFNLYLSLINDGGSYPRRCTIAQSQRSKAAKISMYASMLKKLAREEAAEYDLSWNVAMLEEAANLVSNYMQEHVKEL